MTENKPTVLLLHGDFAESASWNRVVALLQLQSLKVMAVTNPLRSLPEDAAYLRDVIASVGQPVLLVGHSYAGMVITEAGSANDSVVGLVYVNAFVPIHGESALDLSNSAPGSTLGVSLASRALSTGENEFFIKPELFQHQFAADVADDIAALMAATQRPVTEIALSTGLATDMPAWMTVPSWFVFSDQDLNIPVAVHRLGAVRAASRGTREIAGGSHAISVSNPNEVAATILEAVAALSKR